MQLYRLPKYLHHIDNLCSQIQRRYQKFDPKLGNCSLFHMRSANSARIIPKRLALRRVASSCNALQFPPLIVFLLKVEQWRRTWHKVHISAISTVSGKALYVRNREAILCYHRRPLSTHNVILPTLANAGEEVDALARVRRIATSVACVPLRTSQYSLHRGNKWGADSQHKA